MMESEEVDKSKLPGFVYLMDDGRDLKIGLTGDITKRLKQYKTENPRLELLDYFQCDNYQHAEDVEAELIDSTKEFTTFGKEWRERVDAVFENWRHLKIKHALLKHDQWKELFKDFQELDQYYRETLAKLGKSFEQIIESKDELHKQSLEGLKKDNEFNTKLEKERHESELVELKREHEEKDERRKEWFDKWDQEKRQTERIHDEGERDLEDKIYFLNTEISDLKEKNKLLKYFRRKASRHDEVVGKLQTEIKILKMLQNIFDNDEYKKYAPKFEDDPTGLLEKLYARDREINGVKKLLYESEDRVRELEKKLEKHN